MTFAIVFFCILATLNILAMFAAYIALRTMHDDFENWRAQVKSVRYHTTRKRKPKTSGPQQDGNVS